MRFRLTLFALFLALLTGCASYQQRWQIAARSPQRDPLAGAYLGRWESNAYRNADGRLWCILQPAGKGRYTAEFRATWHGLFSSTHKAELVVVKPRISSKEEIAFLRNQAFSKPWVPTSSSAMNAMLYGKRTPTILVRGAARIEMWIGSGDYRCEALLRPESITAYYDSTLDRGEFRLTRSYLP